MVLGHLLDSTTHVVVQVLGRLLYRVLDAVDDPFQHSVRGIRDGVFTPGATVMSLGAADLAACLVTEDATGVLQTCDDTVVFGFVETEAATTTGATAPAAPAGTEEFHRTVRSGPGGVLGALDALLEPFFARLGSMLEIDTVLNSQALAPSWTTRSPTIAASASSTGVRATLTTCSATC